ncbi:hypothetical protein DEU56DRAFT_908422 [Suillus clintonianus]|uniref:uncharacterized protein n=1 Tax=Suillus clintonianus TaxID=1904413 RepID=UPI001B87E97C|nr:uncharacterized protein DEU56DRAFT_908422 [Suillus clintonianus]KAG2150782.1 hypothetical protein DEU56DRAFT_908422 [Suillus clintonianus]
MRPESDHETSRIDYLDLHAEYKHLIEIEIVLCVIPAIKSSLHTSDPFVGSDESYMLHSMYSIFSSFADLVCHCRYKSQWNTVKLPKSMRQRLAKLDDNQQKSSTRSLDESSYVFPDPLVSMPDDTPTISDVEDWTHDSMGSESYTFSSAHPFDVMPLSSTCSSLHSLSDDGHELKVLDEPVYRTSTARRPQITSTENEQVPG